MLMVGESAKEWQCGVSFSRVVESNRVVFVSEGEVGMEAAQI